MRLLSLSVLCSALLALLPLAAEEKKAETKTPEVGKPAPIVELPATQIDKLLPDKKDAKTLNLNEFKGKKNVILFFYPKAMTGGCTKESCAFRDRVDKLAKHDTVVIGISTDKVDDQQKFTDKEKLNFPLFADTDKKVTRAFGALNARGMANRYTFIIDKEGVVRKAYVPVKDAASHPQEVLEFVEKTFAK